MIINLYAVLMRLMGMRFRVLPRLILGLAVSGAVTFGNGEAAAQAANRLSPAETQLCATLQQCLDILDRHGPDEFDYHVLQKAILKMGPSGKSALFRRLSSKDEKVVTRVQTLLSNGSIIYEPQYQTQIAALWPRGDLKAHAAMMRANLSPAVMSRAIETLSHVDDDIQAQSRSIIDVAAKLNISPILNQTDYGRLAKAAIAAPSPAMVTLLKNAPAQTSEPILTRILRSSDGPSVIAAYEALFAHDPKTAFQTLVGTFYDLKDTEAQTALALATLLRRRHEDRADGFYLKFASDIAKDPKMSAMGRMAGFDAVMGHKDNKADILTNSPLMVENLKTALANYDDLPLAYAKNLYNVAKDNPQAWVNVMWAKLKSDPYKHPQTADAFFSQLTKLPILVTQDSVNQAFKDTGDFGLLILAIKTAVAQKDKTRLAQIEKFKAHPISDVRAYATLAVTALKAGSGLDAGKIGATMNKENKSTKICRATPTDFRKEAQQLPFFDLKSKFVQSVRPLRTYVQTAAPTLSGWLVGYAAKDAGGDLQFYNNTSGNGVSLLGKTELTNVSAILPVIPQALGQYASEFWAVVSDGAYKGRAAIYRLSEVGNNYRIIRHAQLPSGPAQITQHANGDVFMSFYDDTDKSYVPHPPLIVSKTGNLRRACEGPKNNILKALP